MTKKILVIEDNPQNMYLVRFILEAGGMEVLEAYDGAAGISLADTSSPDIILLDIQIPVMDGYAVARVLRQNPRLDRVPVIAVTSYAMAGDREKALASGCNGYIEKPIDPANFLSQILSIAESSGGGRG